MARTTLRFTVTVTVEHQEGRFVSNAALAEKLTTSLESAADEHWRGLDVGNSSYAVTNWRVEPDSANAAATQRND